MTKTNIFEATVEHFLAPIMPYMNDPTVSEIMVNAPDEIYIEREGRVHKTDARFDDDEALLAAVKNVLQFTGKQISQQQPLVDSRLPDGSRVHVILYPLCRTSTVVCIRKFAKTLLDADRLLELGSWTPEMMDYLSVCVRGAKNVLVAGGTSSGKTSLLNVLSGFVPDHERVVVIEDSAELDFRKPHVLSLESRPPDRWGRGEVTIRDLFRSALRLRPDRVIIGEVRGGEALDVIQAMTSGHAGSMTTLHATGGLDALNRLETLAMMSTVELPLHALRAQIASAIDVLVQLTRFTDGRRMVTGAAEVLPLGDDGKYRIREIFRYEPSGADGEELLTWTGEKSLFADQADIRRLREHWNRAADVFGGKK
ncbi:MAG: CpaF family protein [Phycisphaerae bacterium]